ncbi:glycosyltransferase family 4 protein [Lewinella sp. IMCC34191]|uniref:glycosyltransferase family 4 protein n=1 Tax=Lewinella sp. IMCC34191 TaxID=2259172 RepID=UPI000E25975C|nr:glycosyltransferase family 1 protein [Lewinella sp. IMCC34191]
MKIAVNTRFLYTDQLEGIGYFTQEICRRLPDLLPEAQFLFCFDRSYPAKYVSHDRVRGVRIFPPARDPILWKIWFDYALPQVVEKWQADVLLHLDGYCSLRTDCPQVMVVHDIAHLHYPEAVPKRAERYYRKNVPRFLDTAKKVITVSNFVKEDIGQAYHIPPDKVEVSGNGVREIFQPLSAERIQAVRDEFTGGRPYFFYLGAVHPRKNIERLISAYTSFREQSADPYPLLLGGRLAWQTDSVRVAYEQCRFREDIVFLGYRPDREIADLLGSSLALVYPSLSEGFGVPLLEAMHVEVPIITSNRTSLPEVAGRAAYYVDPESISAIAKGLVEVAASATLRARLVAAGRAERSRYGWDEAARIIAGALNDLPDRTGSGSGNIL